MIEDKIKKAAEEYQPRYSNSLINHAFIDGANYALSISGLNFNAEKTGTTENVKKLLEAANELRFKIENVAEINGNDILWDAASAMSDTIALLTEAVS
jgi:hypothetical protein